MDTNHVGIQVEIPGRGTLVLTQLLLDFTGTLSWSATADCIFQTCSAGCGARRADEPQLTVKRQP